MPLSGKSRTCIGSTHHTAALAQHACRTALQPASTQLTLLRWQCGNLLRRHLGKLLQERLSAASRANRSWLAAP
jgi:hypothetical protein